MITKLLLQEKVTDINVKLDGLKDELQAGLESLAILAGKVRDGIKEFDLETTDQDEIARINDSIEMYYDDLRYARNSLSSATSAFRLIGQQMERAK